MGEQGDTGSDIDIAESLDAIKGAAKMPHRVNIKDNIVKVKGGSPNAPISIYNMGGKLVKTSAMDAEGKASINIANLAKEVYVVNPSNVSFKIKK